LSPQKDRLRKKKVAEGRGGFFCGGDVCASNKKDPFRAQREAAKGTDQRGKKSNPSAFVEIPAQGKKNALV